MDLSLALGLLASHRSSGISEDEKLTVDRIVRFMGAHPDCLLRTCLEGHLTGSAWILSRDRTRTLLTHHGKLGKWLQLGGHADGDPDMLAVALREAREESGLASVEPEDGRLFDVDRHWIPSRKLEPGHWHHDFRFVFLADPDEPLTVSNESKALAWVRVSEVASLNPEESMARMVRKTLAR
jgi:8-oxo-dGTP pyrophosphatase MutT (NUDIX family)